MNVVSLASDTKNICGRRILSGGATPDAVGQVSEHNIGPISQVQLSFVLALFSRVEVHIQITLDLGECPLLSGALN